MKSCLLLSVMLLSLPATAQTCEKGQADPVPLSRYRLQGAQVLDTRTGLTWLRCSQGQTWTGKTCNGKVQTLTTRESVAAVAAFNAGPAAARFGMSTWRLPTQDELLSLVATHCSNPAINLKVFPGTVSAAYWTSASPGGTGQWSVNFSDGFEEIFNANRPSALRLVRK